MTVQINPTVARLRCSLSGLEVPSNDFARPLGLCPCCPAPGKPLVVEYDRDEVVAAWQRPGPHPAGLFRFGPMLPVVNVPNDVAGDVGDTPVLRHRRLSEALGVEVFLKNESANPSGSFKDRALAMGIAFGVACGAQRFSLPTQGNAGVAACLFSARFGLPPALVYIPDGYQGSIYHRACTFFGGEVRFFGPNIAGAGKQMREDLRAQLASGELVDISTFFEPGRLEGKKTMGPEIAASFAGQSLPDAIMGHAMLQAIRESNGFAAAVDEAAIRCAFADLGRLGVGAGYESAVTVASVREAVAAGRIAKGSRVLLLLTGSHMIPLAKAAP